MIIKTAKNIDNAFIIKAINEKLADNPRLQRLQDYYEGRQDILLRTFTNTQKPNNRIVVNYSRKIADFLTSYLVGTPIRYNAPQIILDTLNFNDEADTTQEIVRNMNIMGLGCELFYTDGDGFPRFANIDPRESIFVTDDSIEGNLVAYIRFYPNADEPELFNVTVYDDTEIAEYSLSSSVGELTRKGEPTTHFFGDVPATMYLNNPEMSGAFEGIISLQNAINTVLSDNVNDFESFVDSYMVLKGLQGTQREDLERMKEDRILILEAESGAEWLTKSVNPAHIKELKEGIISKIHELGCIPDVVNLGSFGASGVALRFKLIGTDIAAAKQERTVHRGIFRRLELLYNILTISDSQMGRFTDVNIEFTRNFIVQMDEIAKRQFDLSLVERHILSKETFLQNHLGMTPDEAKEELRLVSIETETDDWASDTYTERTTDDE